MMNKLLNINLGNPWDFINLRQNNRRHLNSLIVSDSAYCIVTSISNGLYLTNNFFFCFFPYLHLFVYLNDLLGMTSYLKFFFLLFFFSSEALSTSSLLLSRHWFLDLQYGVLGLLLTKFKFLLDRTSLS